MEEIYVFLNIDFICIFKVGKSLIIKIWRIFIGAYVNNYYVFLNYYKRCIHDAVTALFFSFSLFSLSVSVSRFLRSFTSITCSKIYTQVFFFIFNFMLKLIPDLLKSIKRKLFYNLIYLTSPLSRFDFDMLTELQKF